MRNGRLGQWLVTDDYTGFTRYASDMKTDYWGNIVKKPLKRNLQEIASPLNDPLPVTFYRGPSYETINTVTLAYAPATIGNTSTPTPLTSPAAQALKLTRAP